MKSYIIFLRYIFEKLHLDTHLAHLVISYTPDMMPPELSPLDPDPPDDDL